MPASLNCPTCGAPAAGPTASRCEYCGSTLTSTACPSCFGAMFAGMQFCPHCGAKGDRALEDSKPLQCPACRGEMPRVRIGTTSLFECSACQSTWLDAETFTSLCTNREEHGAITAMVNAKKTVPASVTGGAVRYLPCPICQRVMNRENFGRRSGVIIDVCKGHGVWFERGELPAVIAFIDNGGLERARAAQADRDREQRQRTTAELKAMADAYTSLAAQGPPPSIANSLINEALRMLFND